MLLQTIYEYFGKSKARDLYTIFHNRLLLHYLHTTRRYGAAFFEHITF